MGVNLADLKLTSQELMEVSGHNNVYPEYRPQHHRMLLKEKSFEDTPSKELTSTCMHAHAQCGLIDAY
jgi:hypothetical protein